MLEGTPCHPHRTRRYQLRQREEGESTDEEEYTGGAWGDTEPGKRRKSEKSLLQQLKDRWTCAMVTLAGRLEELPGGVGEQDVHEFCKVGLLVSVI